jgi:hypothetical protein
MEQDDLTSGSNTSGMLEQDLGHKRSKNYELVLSLTTVYDGELDEDIPEDINNNTSSIDVLKVEINLEVTKWKKFARIKDNSVTCLQW